MPALRKFCGCCELKNGALFLGWLMTVSYIILFILSAVVLANIDSIIAPIRTDYQYIDEDNVRYISEDNDGAKFAIKIACIVTLVVSFIFGIAAILLIFGTLKRNKYLLLPWLILNGIGIFVNLVMVFMFLFMMFTSYGDDVVISLLNDLILIITTGVQFYFWLCILSLFHHIQEERLNDYGDRRILFPYQLIVQQSMQQQHQQVPGYFNSY